mmetsp:Transcript_16550/g.53232  ORF Transcript_16550/g.53232 Transcript_16550/m.53232 type:complete len:495 (+) Transcript_16550:711-2195(+)
MTWLKVADVAMLEATSSAAARTWSVDAFAASLARRTAPSGRLVRPSRLAWAAVLQRATGLAESWGTAAATRGRLLRSTQEIAGDTLDLVEFTPGPPVTTCAAALVAAMQRHSGAGDVQTLCAASLAQLSFRFPEAAAATCMAGGTSLLLELLQSPDGNPQLQQHCASVLAAAMVTDAQVACTARRSGCVPRLVALSQSSCQPLRAAALEMIMNIAYFDSGSREEIRQAGAIPQVVALLHARCRLEPLHAIDILVSSDACSCAEFRRAGGVRKIALLLRHKDMDFQESAAGILANVLGDDEESCRELRDVPFVVPKLVALLSSKNWMLQANCADALSCIAAEGRGAELIMAANGLKHLLPLLSSTHAYSRDAAVAAIAVIVQVLPSAAADKALNGRLEALLEVLARGMQPPSEMSLGRQVAMLLGTEDARASVTAALALPALRAAAAAAEVAGVGSGDAPRVRRRAATSPGGSCRTTKRPAAVRKRPAGAANCLR